MIIEEAKVLGGQTTELKSNNGTQYYQQDRVYNSDGLAMCEPANLPGGSYKYLVKEEVCVAMRGRNPDKPTDRTPGIPTQQRLEKAPQGIVNTLTTVQKDNLILEQEYIDIPQATKDGSIECKVGGCYNSNYPDSKTRRGRVVEDGDVTPTLTVADIEKINYVETKYRIRKLTPKECWRLMGYTDEDFDKAAYERKRLYIQGSNSICNAKLKAVQERPIHTDMESFVSCTINDSKSMETLKIIKTLLAETQEQEKMQNVDFVMTRSEGLEHLGCVTGTTKCITFMGMQCTLMQEKDRLIMVITESEKEDRQSTGKYMKITTESNLNPLKLYTILILTELIMTSKIYGSTTLQASIKGYTQIIDVCENSIRLKISDLKMENMSVRVSSSQLYKQAGNAIAKQVLMAIFAQMIPQSARASS